MSGFNTGSLNIVSSVDRFITNYNNNYDTLTTGAELVSLSGKSSSSISEFRGIVTGTGVTYYAKTAEVPGEQTVYIRRRNSNTVVAGVALTRLTAADEGSTVTFSFRDPFIYEGTFINPPYKESLDSSPTNPFLLSDFYVNQYSLFTHSYIQASGWKRIYKLPKSSSVARWAFWGKIIILKSYTHGLYEHYVVTFALHYNASEESESSYYIEPVIYRQQNTVGKILSKFRFARDPNNLNEVYLEGYYRSNTSNYLDVCLRDFMREGTDYVQHIMHYPGGQQKTAEDIYSNSLCSLSASYPNDVILGAEVTTIEKSVLISS